MNSQNLISNNERSPEELREMGRKGGIKSGESRRRKRDLQRAARFWLEVFDQMEQQGISAAEIGELLGKLPRVSDEVPEKPE